MCFFHAFYDQGSFEKSLNATFIALILKKGGAIDVQDFRPISLVGCFYKLIAKVLASRLRKVLDGVISDSHNVFVGGRQILDSVLIASECVDSRLSCRSRVFYASWILRRHMIMDVVSQLEVSHLMFADDTLVLCDVDASQTRYLRCVLIWFQVVSGLKVNIGKSVLVLVGDVPEIKMFAQILGCCTGFFSHFLLRVAFGSPFEMCGELGSCCG
ncbi:uncharacterized protein LOC132270023 [Cornus florida]|uniref:uncharacterized protein LOC132270023 n=1 Tax=Cornus florida TaxID=4283 RepID=UPI00289BF89B|nr:uncharacterized protein LOC132270023 [Cornus florida]